MRGDVWAYKVTLTGPLVPARIIVPPWHYGADIRVRRLDDPALDEFWTKRPRLPCKWEDVDMYLAAHPEIRRDDEPMDVDGVEPRFRDAADELFGIGKAALRQIVRSEVERTLQAPQKLAYSYQEASAAVGVSVDMLRGEVRDSRLVASYVGSKPVFTVDELKRWLGSLPSEPRR